MHPHSHGPIEHLQKQKRLIVLFLGLTSLFAASLTHAGARHSLAHRFRTTSPSPDTLHSAVQMGDLTATQSFLANSKKLKTLNQIHRDGFTSLHLAILKGHREIVDALLAAGASTTIPTETRKKDLPIHLAAKTGQIQIFDSIHLKNPTQLNQPTEKDGLTPLHLAALFDQTDMISHLLHLGADPSIASKHGDTPLFAAISAGKLKSILFLYSELKMRSQNKEQIESQILTHALGVPNIILYRKLRKNGLRAHSDSPTLQLIFLIAEHKIETAKKRLNEETPFYDASFPQLTPLFVAYATGHFELCSYILKIGTDQTEHKKIRLNFRKELQLAQIFKSKKLLLTILEQYAKTFADPASTEPLDIQHTAAQILESDTCSICLNEYDSKENELELTQCNHLFCKPCLDQLRRHASRRTQKPPACPLCNAALAQKDSLILPTDKPGFAHAYQLVPVAQIEAPTPP